VMREFCNDAGIRAWRLILAIEVRAFGEAARLIGMWQPRVVVIDAMPEIHEVSRIKKKFKNMWASQFQEGKLELGRDRKNKIIKMDRTSILDFVKKGYDEQTLLLPETADTILNYYSQLQASTRVLEVNENNPERSRYVWKHTKPDHYFLAEAYCMQAIMMVPSSGVLDYYSSEVERMKTEVVPTADEIVEHIGEEKTKDELERLQHVSKERFLQGLHKTYGVRPTIVRSTQDAESEIATVIEQLNKQHSAQGGFTLQQFNRASGLRGEEGRKFLLRHGYMEGSGGVFVKAEA